MVQDERLAAALNEALDALQRKTAPSKGVVRRRVRALLLERWDQVQELRERGWSLSAIAREVAKACEITQRGAFEMLRALVKEREGAKTNASADAGGQRKRASDALRERLGVGGGNGA